MTIEITDTLGTPDMPDWPSDAEIKRAESRVRRLHAKPLSRAMAEAIDLLRQHGSCIMPYYLSADPMRRAEWTNSDVEAEAPRVNTLDALVNRGLVKIEVEYHYRGHGEYDDEVIYVLDEAVRIAH